MGYFNYFIKCIIRNIAYRLCKPKFLLTILLAFAILFVLHSTGYCSDWTDGEIEACLDGLATITNNQGVIISQLSSMGVNVSALENELKSINTELDNISTYTSNINGVVSNIFIRVNSLNTTLTQMAQEQKIYYEDVTKQLEEIKNVLLGVSVDSTNSLILSSYLKTEPFLRCSVYG